MWKQMFKNCVSLTSIPDVPGMDRPTTYQCQEMFSGCSSLTDVDLPFERINDGSYSCASMFANCSQLSSMVVKFTSWNGNATDNWLNGVAATGTFYCPSALGTNDTIERGVSRCPVGWTVVNGTPQGPFWRFTVRGAYRLDSEGNPATGDDARYTQLGELYMWDANGNRVNQNLELQTPHYVEGYTDLSWLSAGQVTQGRDQSSGGPRENLSKMFDDDQSTKWAVSNPIPVSGDSTTWPMAVMRLQDGVQVASYNFRSANDGNPPRNIVSWTFENSTDGINWTEVTRVDNYTTGIPTDQFELYNGGTAFQM